MTVDLFGPRPRKPPQKLMHVADAGDGCIRFICDRCGNDTGWISWDKSVTEAKRGIPCTFCNRTPEAT